MDIFVFSMYNILYVRFCCNTRRFVFFKLLVAHNIYVHSRGPPPPHTHTLCCVEGTCRVLHSYPSPLHVHVCLLLVVPLAIIAHYAVFEVVFKLANHVIAALASTSKLRGHIYFTFIFKY